MCSNRMNGHFLFIAVFYFGWFWENRVEILSNFDVDVDQIQDDLKLMPHSNCSIILTRKESKTCLIKQNKSTFSK